MRKIAGVKRTDKQRMEELSEEVGERESREEAGVDLAKVGCTRGEYGRKRLKKTVDALRLVG